MSVRIHAARRGPNRPTETVTTDKPPADEAGVMTRLVHTGDTHLGYRQYHSPERRRDFLRAFERVIDDAIAAEVDAVIHAGDLFDDRQPGLPDISGALSALERLEAAGIPFLAVVGNHESKRDGQWLDLFEQVGVATRLGPEPVEVGDVAVYGLDFVPRSRREALEYEFEPTDAAHAVLVTHGLFEPFEHGDWDARRLLRESPVAFDALLLGDDHTHRVRRLEEPTETWLTYAGSTERASASEREDRGYNVVAFEDGVDVRRRGLDTRSFVYVDVELGADQGLEQVRRAIEGYDLEDAVVIVTITGEGSEIAPAAIEEFAAERGALVTRVTDRRDVEDDTVEVSFADPDAAVRERIETLGLSPAAREIDELVRDGSLADSNVADNVERRVGELADEPAAFAAVETPSADAGGSGDEPSQPGESNSAPQTAGDGTADDGSTAATADRAIPDEDADGTDAAGENSETDSREPSGDDGHPPESAERERADDGDDQATMEEYL